MFQTSYQPSKAMLPAGIDPVPPDEGNLADTPEQLPPGNAQDAVLLDHDDPRAHGLNHPNVHLNKSLPYGGNGSIILEYLFHKDDTPLLHGAEKYLVMLAIAMCYSYLFYRIVIGTLYYVQDRLWDDPTDERKQMARIILRQSRPRSDSSFVIICVLIILIPNQVHLTNALPAYTCKSANVSFGTLDLLEPAECPDPKTSYMEPQAKTAQIFQVGMSTEVNGTRCKAELTRTATRCGFDSINYGSITTAWKEQVEITPEACRKAASIGILDVGGRSYSPPMGIPTSYAYFSHGNVDQDGACETRKFQRKGKIYDGFYEETVITVTVENIRGRLHKDDREVFFPHIRRRAPYADKVLQDAVEGTTVWTKEHPPCGKTVSLLYTGEAQLHRHRRTWSEGGDNPLQKSILLVANGDTKQYTGLVLRDRAKLCNMPCHHTQEPDVVVCLPPTSDLTVFDLTNSSDYQFQPHFEQHHLDMQSQMHFLHLSSRLQTHAQFEDVAKGVCEGQRGGMYNKIQALSGANNKYALLDIYGPGHRVVVSGAAAYVLRCAPVDVERREYHNCTKDVPVFHDGKPMFMDPLTYTLHDYTSDIPCDRLFPARWKLGSKWYCSFPELSPCDAPDQLEPSFRLNSDSDDQDITEGVGHGIFTDEMRSSHERAMRVSEAALPLLMKMASSASDNADERGELGAIWSAGDYDTLSDAVTARLIPFFWMTGRTFQVLLGIVLIFSIIQTIALGSIRTLRIYQDRGCGWWLLGGLWATVTAILLVPRNVFVSLKDQLHRDDYNEFMNMAAGPDQRRRCRDCNPDRRNDDHDRDSGDGGSGATRLKKKYNRFLNWGDKPKPSSTEHAAHRDDRAAQGAQALVDNLEAGQALLDDGRPPSPQGYGLPQPEGRIYLK